MLLFNIIHLSTKGAMTRPLLQRSYSWIKRFPVGTRACGHSFLLTTIGDVCRAYHHHKMAVTSLFELRKGLLEGGYSVDRPYVFRSSCTLASKDLEYVKQNESEEDDGDKKLFVVDSGVKETPKETTKREGRKINFTKIDVAMLPTILLVGRPNVGKSALFNRLIRRREALVYNTPDDHVTRDIREGVAKLGTLRFKLLDSAGLETEATSESILARTTSMTASILSKVHFLIFLIDARTGLHPLDLEVGKWLRKHAPRLSPIVVMNKCESLMDKSFSIAEIADEAQMLGFGDPVAISAETGLGMTALHATLQPLLESYVLRFVNESSSEESCHDDELSDAIARKIPLQLALVGRPNVGKSTLLNTLVQEERVIVGPEAGLTRDSIRVQFQFQGRTVYLVDTAGWLHRTKLDKGPSSLSIVQSRKNLMRAHVIALVLDAEEISKARRCMTHAEVVILRRAVEEGRAVIVIVNKMDIVRKEGNSDMYQKIMKAVPEEIQTIIPQVTGIPVVFTSAILGSGGQAVMNQVVKTYEKWCLRLSTARINRWMRKVMSRHSWKDQVAQPKIKYFTQVKARPPTFVAFTSGKTELSGTDLRFLTKSLKEDFDLGGIPVRIMQRSAPQKFAKSQGMNHQPATKIARVSSDKKLLSV